MAYEAKNFEHLIGTTGFSDRLLRNHFALYQGYVTNTNKIIDTILSFEQSEKTNTPEYAELRRRFGWEFNGMRLHELYFGNMVKGGSNINRSSILFIRIVEDFGSYENFEKSFKAVASMRGIGWVILYYDKVSGHMLTVWVNEHDVGHLSGAVPLLVMDVFEHAYMIDYDTKRADYIDSFFSAIDWGVVEKRFDDIR